MVTHCKAGRNGGREGLGREQGFTVALMCPLCVLQGGNSALSLAHGDIAAILRAHIELSPSLPV